MCYFSRFITIVLITTAGIYSVSVSTQIRVGCRKAGYGIVQLHSGVVFLSCLSVSGCPCVAFGIVGTMPVCERSVCARVSLCGCSSVTRGAERSEAPVELGTSRGCRAVDALSPVSRS